jgi:hypothetical protein
MADINDRLLFSPAPQASSLPPASGLVFPRTLADSLDTVEFLLVETTRTTGLRTKQINDLPLTLTDSLTVQVTQ